MHVRVNTALVSLYIISREQTMAMHGYCELIEICHICNNYANANSEAWSSYACWLILKNCSRDLLVLTAT